MSVAESSLQDVNASLLQILKWHEFKATAMGSLELQRVVANKEPSQTCGVASTHVGHPPRHATCQESPSTSLRHGAGLTWVSVLSTLPGAAKYAVCVNLAGRCQVLPGAAKSAMAEGGYYQLLVRKIRARTGYTGEQIDT